MSIQDKKVEYPHTSLSKGRTSALAQFVAKTLLSKSKALSPAQSQSVNHYSSINESATSDMENSAVWINFSPCLLYKEDKEIIQSSAWLNDRIINAAQKRLQVQATDISGWQSTLYQKSFPNYEVIDSEQDFVQIVHIRSYHWATVSNIGCDVCKVNQRVTHITTLKYESKEKRFCL